MNPLLIAPVLELGKGLLDRWFPDKEQARKAEAEMLVMLAEGDLKKTLAQIETNAKEAAHPSIFVAGWRSFTGWACAFGLIWSTAGQTVFTWLSAIYGFPPPPPIDVDTLNTVLFGLLGLGGLRTFEKIKGSQKDTL